MAEFKMDDLGERAKTRPTPSLHGTMAAVGGLAAALGLAVLTGDKFTSTGSTGVGLISGILLIVAGYAVLAKLPERVRSAAIAMIAAGVVTIAAYIVIDELDSITTLMLILAVGFGAAYLAPLSRGEQTFAVGALAAVWLLILDTVSENAANDPLGGGSGFLDPVGQASDTTVAYVSLGIGLGLLLAVRRLDKDGYSGLATSMVIVGDLAFLVGVFGLIGSFDSDGLSSLVVIAAGLVLGFVGSAEGRRFTTWLGGILALAGLLALVVDAFSDSDSVASMGVALIVVGAAIVAGIAYIVPASDPGEGVSSSVGGPL